MWRRLMEQSGAVPSCPPADPAVLHRVEESLGHPLPPDLSALLLETDGIEGPYGEGVVWPAEQILENNRTLRTDPEIRSLVAADLAGYVRRALESGGEDWYR